MTNINVFYDKVLNDINKQRDDLDIIILHAMIQLVEKIKNPNIFKDGLKFLTLFLSDTPEIPGIDGVLPDSEKKLLLDVFLKN